MGDPLAALKWLDRDPSKGERKNVAKDAIERYKKHTGSKDKNDYLAVIAIVDPDNEFLVGKEDLYSEKVKEAKERKGRISEKDSKKDSKKDLKKKDSVFSRLFSTGKSKFSRTKRLSKKLSKNL